MPKPEHFEAKSVSLRGKDQVPDILEARPSTAHGSHAVSSLVDLLDPSSVGH